MFCVRFYTNYFSTRYSISVIILWGDTPVYSRLQMQNLGLRGRRKWKRKDRGLTSGLLPSQWGLPEPLCSLGGQQPDWSARPFPHGTELCGGGVSASLMFFVFLPPPLFPLVCAREICAAVRRLFLGLNDSNCYSFLLNIFFAVTMSCLLRTLRFWGKHPHGYGFCSCKCPPIKCKR